MDKLTRIRLRTLAVLLIVMGGGLFLANLGVDAYRKTERTRQADSLTRTKEEKAEPLTNTDKLDSTRLPASPPPVARLLPSQQFDLTNYPDVHTIFNRVSWSGTPQLRSLTLKLQDTGMYFQASFRTPKQPKERRRVNIGFPQLLRDDLGGRLRLTRIHLEAGGRDPRYYPISSQIQPYRVLIEVFPEEDFIVAAYYTGEFHPYAKTFRFSTLPRGGRTSPDGFLFALAAPAENLSAPPAPPIKQSPQLPR